MRILGIRNTNYQNLSFERRLRKEEERPYQETQKEALKVLGVDNLAMIIHGSSHPSVAKDGNIGSPISKGAKRLIRLEKLNGFNSEQLGPMGKLSKIDFSPYSAKVFAKNHLFINLEELTTEKYSNILSKKTYNYVTDVHKIPDKNYNNTDFLEAFENYDIALSEAYSSFKTKLNNGDENTLNLNTEFEEFKEKSSKWLLKDGLFKVLANVYGTDNFDEWKNPIDRNLINEVEHGNKNAILRYNQLLNRSGSKIEKNSFKQFLIDKQLKEHKQWREENHFKYINDLLVGFATSDVWSNPDAFLKDMRMGSHYGGFNNGPQIWDIPVLDPKKLFNNDGSIGVAGQLLKDKIDNSLEHFENIRIDHALGFVDPYIYRKSTLDVEPNGRVNHIEADDLIKWKEFDPNGDFKRILPEIVLPALKEHGISNDEVVWEDLCHETDAFKEVYRHNLNLNGISQLEYKKGENSPRNNWALVGSHDSKPAIMMNMKDDSWNACYLAGFLNADADHTSERIEARNKYAKYIDHNPMEHVKAKFAELFLTANNVQISFADFFGINQVYNYGGQKADTNWKLRLNNDFEDTYYKNLSGDNPTALNMPEVLKMSVKGKFDLAVAKMNKENSEKADKLREYLKEKYEPLLDKLQHWSEVLKEKEQD